MANKIVALFAVCFCGPAVATGGPRTHLVVINRREQKQGSCLTHQKLPSIFRVL